MNEKQMQINDKQLFKEYLIRKELSNQSIRVYLNYFDRLFNYGQVLNKVAVDKLLSERIYKTSDKPNNNVKRAFINRLLDFYDLPKDFIKIDKPTGRKEKKIKRFLKPNDVEYLIKELPFEQSLIVQLITETGLRLHELDNIKVTDINFEDNSVRGMGKGRKEFELYFSDDTKTKLKEIINIKKKEYIFKHTDVKHSTHKIWRLLKKECENLPLPILNIHPHDFRHYLGWYLRVVKKLDLIQVASILRHDSVETTQIYAGAEQQEIKTIMKELLQ